MFDRNIRMKADAQGGYDFILSDLYRVFRQSDLVVANLEGPVTDFPSRSVGTTPGAPNNYSFTFDPRSLEALQPWPVLVSLGNNHTLNFGLAGLAQTYRYLDEAGIRYFGHVASDEELDAFVVIDVGGIAFGFVNYNQFIDGGRERALSDIATVRPEADLLVLYAHWGSEYVQEGSAIRQLAHEFVDAEVDLVIGSHPHVVQGVEDYQGTRIYYSLGNFVFDQYFDEAVQKGLLVQASACESAGGRAGGDEGGDGSGRGGDGGGRSGDGGGDADESADGREGGSADEHEGGNADGRDGDGSALSGRVGFAWAFTEHPIRMRGSGETVRVEGDPVSDQP